MNNDNKILDRNPVSPPVSGNQVQPQMGSLNKEAPIATGLSELRPAGPEAKHNIDQEITQLGVREIEDRPDLTQVADVQHAGPSIPVSAMSSASIHYPMSEDEVTKQLKTGQGDDSGKWLAGLIKKVIAVMGL